MLSTKPLTVPSNIEINHDQYFDILISNFKNIVVTTVPEKFQSACNTFLSLLADDILLLREDAEVNIMIEYDPKYPETFTVVGHSLYPFVFDTMFLTIDLSKPVNNMALADSLEVTLEGFDNESTPKLPYFDKSENSLFQEHCLDMKQSVELMYNIGLIDQVLGLKGKLIKSFFNNPLSHTLNDDKSSDFCCSLFSIKTSLNVSYNITLNSTSLKFYIMKDSINCTFGNNHFHMHTNSNRQKEDLKNLKQLFVIYYNMMADFPCRDIKRIVKLLEMMSI